MGESVVSDVVAGLIFVANDFRKLASRFTDDEEGGRNILLFQNIQDLRSPSFVGAIVEGKGELGWRGAHLLDAPGERIGLIGLVVDDVTGGIVIDGAAAALRSGGNAPDVVVAFEN